MKEIKPHEERYFKDIVLRSILNEISNEQGPKPLDDLIPSNPRMSIKRHLTWFIFASLTILALASFFIPTPNKVSEPTQTISVNEEEKKEIAAVQEKLPTKKNSLIIESQDSTEVQAEPKQLSKREIAKARLLEQMKN